jgi:hypothetical protein
MDCRPLAYSCMTYSLAAARRPSILLRRRSSDLSGFLAGLHQTRFDLAPSGNHAAPNVKTGESILDVRSGLRPQGHGDVTDAMAIRKSGGRRHSSEDPCHAQEPEHAVRFARRAAALKRAKSPTTQST